MHWCVVSIGAVAVVGLLLRFIVRKITTSLSIITHVDEYVGNLCSGVFIMELGVISTMYGKYTVIPLLAGFIHLFFKFSYFGYNRLYSSPLTFVCDYYEHARTRRFSFLNVLTIVLTTAAGLYSGQAFAMKIWAYEDHSHVDAMYAACTTAVSLSHPWTYVFLAEAGGVFVGTCMGFLWPVKFKAACGALLTMVLYFLFTHISGMYMNPVIATMFNFRCTGQRSDAEHLLIYWVAPFIGCVAACEFWFNTNIFMRRKIPQKME